MIDFDYPLHAIVQAGGDHDQVWDYFIDNVPFGPLLLHRLEYPHGVIIEGVDPVTARRRAQDVYYFSWHFENARTVHNAYQKLHGRRFVDDTTDQIEEMEKFGFGLNTFSVY